MRFHKTNDISQNFSGIILGFHEVLKYVLDFCIHFQYFRKMNFSVIFTDLKFQSFKLGNGESSKSHQYHRIASCSLFPFAGLFYLISNKSIAKFISLTVYFCSSNFAHPNSVRHFNWEFFRG
jgi:hypothetical protein